MLLEDFREILSERYLKYAKVSLAEWIKSAKECKIKHIVTFAKNIELRTKEILNAIRYKVSNGRLEGFNNLIGRIIHRACGYRDIEYLVLKLRQASLPRELQVPLKLLLPQN
jgi:transposase